LLVRPPSAFAAGDQIDKFNITYDVQTSGVIKVSETITYRFGDSSGRHGIERYFVTRERYDDQHDAVYTIDQVKVTSPDPAVKTQFSSQATPTNNGRGQQLRLRIGDPDVTVSAPTATYVITYDVTGAMRSFPNANPPYDEFYWDATGLDWQATIKAVAIKVTVPGGVQGTTCTYGAVGSATPCSPVPKISNGVATFTQNGLGVGQGVTIGNKIKPGLIRDNKPHLEPDGSKMTPAQQAGAAVAIGAGVLLTIGSPIVGVLWWRRNGRDRRYAGLPPGTAPLPGQPATIVANDPDLPIPVAFSPPKVPVAEAGLLVDGRLDTRETAATLVDLAVRGGLRVQSSSTDEFLVTLLDPSVATAPHETMLLTELFGGAPPGASQDLSEPGSLLRPHNVLTGAVRSQVAARGWFRKVPSGAGTKGVGFGAFVAVIIGAFVLGSWVWWVVLPLLPVIITLLVIRARLRRGQRTADGRAVCDQVEGFRTYLATAEADQLRFEEGEDIFSRYLPWAIVFELADRWAKVCADLVAMGRLPATPPFWYVGNYNLAAFNVGFLTSTLTSAATPAPSAGASGTGFGGGSSFSGGGFSGGGGGGGGGGSW